jgi:twitching motility protein PilT
LRPVSFAGLPKLLPYHTELIMLRLLQGKRDLAEKLLRTGSTDLSYSLARRTRFRVNVFAQRGSYSVVLRVIRTRSRPSRSSGCPRSSTASPRSATGSCC